VPPSVLIRLERGVRDPRLSVIERYAACLGYALRYQLIPSDQADQQPSVAATEEATTNRLRLG
jgi:transcriptional regulator with XRE-family HTH domain